MAGTIWATTPDANLEIRYNSSKFGSLPARTICDVFKDTVRQYGNDEALFFKKTKEDTQWKVWTYQQYYDDCVRFGKSLLALDFAPHRCINILGFNAPAWLISNFGAIFAGGISAGIYTSNLASSCQYISAHSEAEVVVLEDEEQFKKYQQIVDQLPDLKAIVIYSGKKTTDSLGRVRVFTFEEFLDLGSTVDNELFEQRMNSQSPGQCCTLIYTSGTTGPPKAVMLSHDNITWVAASLVSRVNVNHHDRFVSYLPLSHVAAQILDMHGPTFVGAKVYFAFPDAIKGSLALTLRDVRPTFFFGVPRVWEKIYERMLTIGRQTTGLKKMLATWAKEKGLEKSRAQQSGGSGANPFGYSCAHAIVLSKVKSALGLDECRFAATGAAPIAFDVLEYFASLDIPIYEVFGQSECTGPHTINYPTGWKLGTCGRPLPGTESKIDELTGEICYRGRHIFMGYMKMVEKTRETIDDEGWLHSGDIGIFDDDIDMNDEPETAKGFLKITGRLKELIITAGGENIPPVLIELEFMSALSALSGCMVVGDRQKFLTILLALHTEVNEHGLPTNILTGSSLDISREIGSNARTIEEVSTDPKWQEYFNKGMKVANGKTTSRAQIVQKWAIVPRPFSERGGELTPTLKLKRNVVLEKYADLIAEMYVEETK